MRTWISFSNGKKLNARSKRRFSTQAFTSPRREKGENPHKDISAACHEPNF